MKKLVAALLGITMMVGVVTGCSQQGPTENAGKVESEETKGGDEAGASSEGAEAGNFKVGITIQSLANDYFAGVFGEVETLMKEKGWEYTIVDCKGNSAEQISQIENFISADCDLVMVHPADPQAIEDVCKSAQEAGITVMSWDDQLENSDLNWIIDNEELGRTIGLAAAEFINTHYSEDKKAEVAIINYPQMPVLLDRGNGILAGLEEGAKGKYEIVAEQPAIEANVAQSNMETILQAHPDCKIVCTTGSGPDVGANEALKVKTNGEIPEDMGIFSADATRQQLEAIIGGEASHTSVGFEGSNKKTAEAVVDLYEKLLTGETFETKDIQRPLTVISAENAEEYLNDYK